MLHTNTLNPKTQAAGLTLVLRRPRSGAVQGVVLLEVDELLADAVAMVRHQRLAVLQRVVEAHQQRRAALRRKGRHHLRGTRWDTSIELYDHCPHATTCCSRSLCSHAGMLTFAGPALRLPAAVGCCEAKHACSVSLCRTGGAECAIVL